MVCGVVKQTQVQTDNLHVEIPMEIQVNDKQKLLSQDAISKARSRVSASFAKFSDCVQSIDITVLDVNGPRGGVDKECRVLVKLRKMNNVAVTVRDDSLKRAVSSGIDRASRSVRRTIDRRSRPNDNRLGRLGFES